MERSVTGKMDIPLNRKSRSKSWSGIERTKEKEDSDASTHHSVIQSTPQWLSGGFGLPPLKRELKSEKGLIGNASMKDGNLCNMFNPAPKRITWVGVPQQYEMRGKGFKKGNETGLLEGSDLLHHGKHEQNETETTESLFSERIKLKNQQKEETTNLHSEIAWKLPGASFDPGFLSLSMPPPTPVFPPTPVPPPTPVLPIKTRSMGIEQAMLHHHDSRIQEMLHHNSRIQEMLPRRIGSTLMGSRLIPPGKHKQTQTEITGSFLSNTCEHCHVPTWEISEKFPSPGDGLKANRIGRVPKSSHSKYPRSCSLSVTSLADESAAGSSTANPESKEIVTHSIMKPSGTSGSSGLSCLLPCSHSMVSLSKIPCAKNNFTQVNSSSDMLLNEFTPVVTDDFDDENYTFQCSCAGLYQCSVTGLVFLMKGDGDVVYRTVPWNRRLLAQHHKKPAGPLFDIKCQQQSVCQLCLPHCELISTGGAQFLKVAHVDDEGIEFITPQRITESHVVINITGFSGYGNVKDEDSPPDPVQALVLLFYKPPVDPDPRSILSLLLLPRNIVIRDVQRTRRKLIGDEKYVDTSPHCKLHPKQVYTLSTVPQDDLIKVEPTEADFDDEYRNSYFTSFQVILRRILTDLNLSLKDKSSSTCVWERNLSLFSRTVETMNLPPSKRLLNTRSCFTEGISAPNLSSLVDKLLEKTVITNPEREAADAMQNRGEKARFVIDTVRRKGQAASSEFINILRELDRIFFEHLGLN